MFKRPSEYIQERSQTTEERLINASFHSQQQKPKIIELVSSSDSITKISEVPIDRPLFEPLPSEIILQSYKPFQNYEVVISFRNNDKFARKIKLEPINHPHFVVTGLKNSSIQSGKIAPGMEAQFLLKFTPEEETDYTYNLVCATEREKFLLPIRAFGARGILDFPDEIAFSDCPIRFVTTKTLYIRNIGNCPAKFIIDADNPFEALPSSGYLDINKNMQIDINFKPDCAGSFAKNLLVKYDTGEIIRVALSGNAEDAHIRLEKTSIKLENTYITLSSVKAIRIFNRSEKIVKYCWKMFGTTNEDRQHKLKRKLAIDKSEEADCLAFYNQLAKNQSLALCDLSPLTQKYKNKRREIENDLLLFNDSEFSIQPVEGTIWPNSEIEVFIVFNPSKAGPNTTPAYCEVMGRQNRLPLILKGDESSSLFGPKFSFVPRSGLLKVGDQQKIEISFNSDILGSFSEVLEWELEGAPEKLSLYLNGRVIGPTFHFDIPELDFGKLSYRFETSKNFNIVNTSQIPMKFHLKIGSDGLGLENSEFSIVPSSGTIYPLQSVALQVKFTPKSLKIYSECIYVDVESVGENLKQLSIFAESVVPEISLLTPILDYLDCFLAYSYQSDIELRNNTQFCAKYQLMSQEETAKNVYAYSSLNGSGTIMPCSTEKIQITVQIKRLGLINFPIFVKVTGNEDLPLAIDIAANGIGPNVIFSTMELNWGKIPVLKDAFSTLTLTNDSPIPANFTCNTISDSSCFKIEPLFGIIEPGESIDIIATAYLDDCLKFTDILKVGIQSDGVYEVQLVARGQGSTITFDDSLRNIEFHDVFSNRECSCEYVLTNRGRRSQTLHWLGEEDKSAKKESSLISGPTFEVIPSRFLLKPNTSQAVVIKGYSARANYFKETIVCQATLDKDPTRKIIVQSTISANFINPLLDINPAVLKFLSARTDEDDFELLSQNLSLTNTSLLPLHLSFRCPAPYTVDPNEMNFRLNPNEILSLKVNYDPAYNTNRISCKEHSKLVITYSEHPQKDFIELFSEITFPNIKFSTTEINFGCVPNNTEQRKPFLITNTSTLPVEYNWYFLEDSVKMVSDLDKTFISQVFDILPMRSILNAGESEIAEVSFYGHSNNKFNCTALCDVTGGPKYELLLKGEASIIDYSFDRLSLEFGTRMYQDITEQELTITNTGNVAFDYNTIIGVTSSLWQKIMVSPCMGIIVPHEKQKISVRFCACVPEAVDEFFFIQIALFEPIKIRVTGNGIFPLIHLAIPRFADEKYASIYNEIKATLTKNKKTPLLAGTVTETAAKLDEKIEIDIETEVERLLLREKTHKFLAELTKDLQQKAALMTAKVKTIGSVILLSKSLQKSKEKRANNSIFESSAVVLANYLCSFGNVIRNTVKKKSFKMTNRGSHAISFQLDKAVLMGTGFSIEPDRVKLLPGKPYYESVEFQVSFQARSQNIGLIQLELPITVQGGPTTILTLQADVTLPELHLSANEIDFGEVMCGLRKSVFLQLHNKNPVACEWSTLQTADLAIKKVEKLKKKSGNSLLKEFDFVPKSGVLQPGEKILLTVRFSANEEKEYDTIVPLKINMNNQPIQLHLYGRGTKPTIEFEPESIVLGAILPCAEGTEAKFFIHNPTAYAVEIYSLEFDMLYEEEEELLRHVDGYDGNLLYLPPREPGQPLPEALVEQAKANMKANSLLPTQDVPIAVVGVGEIVETVSRNNMRSAGSSGVEAVHEPPFIAIIHGPPFSGKTSQAKRLHSIFEFAYIKIDEVVDAIANVEILPICDQKKENFVKMEDISSIVTRSVFDDKKGAIEADHFEEPKFLSEENFVEILRGRFQQIDCAKGVVIDGLDSKFALNSLIIVKALMKLIGDKRKAVFLNLNVDPAHIKEREAMVLKMTGDHEFDPIHIKDITEEEYDNMTELEREHYDIALMKYKKKVKELQDKRKNERKILEEELAMRMGERKAEEEHMKNGKKKVNKRNTPRIPEKPEKNSRPDQKGTQKFDKGTLSPKTAKKLLEKDSKDPKAVEKIEKIASDIEDCGTFNDTNETFLNESTLKKLEQYNLNLDQIISTLRDSEKAVGNRIIPSSANMKVGGKEKEKEKEKIKTAVVIQPESVIIPLAQDGENLSVDDTNTMPFHDIPGSDDQESVFKFLVEWVPVIQKLEEVRSIPDLIPFPILEQIIAYPPERESQIRAKNFQLLPPIFENEDESPGSYDILKLEGSVVGNQTISNALPQVPVFQPVAILPAQSTTSSKKNRGALKVTTEEIKPVDEIVVEEEVPTKFRWIIPPKERKELIVKFNSTEIGKFEQSLQFEIAGSRTKYSLNCVGNCRYSVMSSDYKKMFPKWRKIKEEKYISHGEYILSTGTFEFGPLLFSKPREKYLEKFPENRAILTISNPSQQEIKIAICFKNDIKSDVFFLDPPLMDLSPGQSQPLNIWAYPRSANYFEDTLIFCVKDNPEPYCYKISCIGVRPELEIDKRQLSFDKLLLNRSEKREIKLKNNTFMPVAWKLVQVELLGEEFAVSPTEGIIEPFVEQIVSAEFKGTKPVVISRRSIRLEVSDTEKIGGVVQEVPIMITAEAYDIAMDLHFPKGYEGGLDFGVIKVLEEGKQVCTLKNKGKYEVGFRFIFENKELAEIFTIIPAQGIMQPSDKPFSVQVIVKATREMFIRDSSLKCQFYEPATSEITANIPVKLQVRSVFSRFSILPVRDLNFGPLVHGTKVSRQFTIENQGEFDFKYSIYKMIQGSNESKNDKKLRTQSRTSKGPRPVSPPPQKLKKEVIKQADATNFGTFTVFPTTSVVAAGAKHQITVEFHSEIPGSFEETVAIDISDRSPNDYLDVIEYRLVAEDCIPGINTSDLVSVFEEQTVCKRLELFNTQSNIYAEEDRVFYFGAFLAGHQAQVRFKISNPFKVPCDVSIVTRPRSRTKSDAFPIAADFAFDVEPKKMTLPSHEYRYITVFFHPTSIQSYAGIFEATVENVDQSKAKTLAFELRGEGTLPRVTIEKPILKNKFGLPLLKFRRLLVGTSQTLPIVLKNEGITTAKVKLEWILKEQDEFECLGINSYHSLRPQETQSIEVRCRALTIRKFESDLRMKVIDNSFEDTIIQLSGEGYMDDLTFDELPSEAENEITFGDCFVGETKQIMFVVSNHSTDILRVSWGLETSDFIFSPTVAHIRPKGKKDITVSFCVKQPIELNHVKALCKALKIKYTNSTSEIDWDDRARAVRWMPNEIISLAPRKLVEQCPEPQYEVLPSNIQDRALIISAYADYSSFECDVSNVKFKTTLMFQTRVFKFNIKNPGKVILKYSFALYGENGQSFTPMSEDCPFSVDPDSGFIDSGETTTIAVKFSPLEDGLFTSTLVANMSNLVKDSKALVIKLTGASLRPFCHFELDDNDYIISERRNPETSINNGVPLNLPAHTKVIEFDSCGVKVRNTKRFYIVNPTNFNYEFEWSTDSWDQKIFRCVTPHGTVMANKKYEMAFEFIPETIDMKESFWKFSIPEHNISIPFLLVGQALEPNVYFDRVSVNFKSLLVGRQVKEVVKLINNESIPFAFSFNETSFEMGNDQIPVMKFFPTSGTIGGHSEVPIEIMFTPSAEKMFNFNLLCNIKKKPTPVSINVKGEGYEIHESLQSELADGTVFEFASGTNVDNILDFGQVQINEKRLKRVSITNSGKFNLDFSWKFLSKIPGVLSIDPEIGTVQKGERTVCEIIFIPSSNIVLKNIKAVCQIMNGRMYPLTVLGIGCKPLLKFSANTHNFGTHFVYRPGMTPMSTKVKITNQDTKEISIDVSTREYSVFDVKKGSSTINPGESTDFEITFYPKEAKSYNELVKVEMNGLSTVNFPVSGVGAEFKVEVLQLESKNVNFGALRAGHIVSKSIKLVNKSLIPAKFSLGPASTIESLGIHCVTISQVEDFILRPKGIAVVDFKFAPHIRIPPFAEEINLEAPGISRPLFLLSGTCQGIEVRLENDTLPFGAIVQKSSTTRRIQLQNIGDIGAKFHWDALKFEPDFSISPQEGYISPGMEIPLEVTFHPTEINQDIRYDALICNVEGAVPLFLTLSGICISQPIQNDVIKFAAPVRQSDVKGIKIENKTSTLWHIRPVIENDNWSGSEAFDVEPGQTKVYDVMFTPLELGGSGDGGRHEGSIFFPLPDGSGLLYKLNGIADKPLSIGNISREVPCKTGYTEILAVTNWLKKTQRFRVIIEFTKTDQSTILKGLDFIDVPGLVTREYKLSYYAYKEGVTNAKIIFKNEQTQEFMFYNLAIKSTPPGVISTVDMVTPVRQLCTREIVISNPLSNSVTFNASCNHPDIAVPHTFSAQPKSDGICVVEFLPLQPKDTTARLTITSSDLGVYQYDLKLTASAASLERSLHFTVGLGGTQIQTFRFLSFSKSKTEYLCRIDSADFFVEKAANAPSALNGGIEVCVDVTYEPSKLGDIRTQLIVSSPVGGDYICPLYGHCTTPRPQGPITIKPGASASVSFKNVFTAPASFSFVVVSVDNPIFSVKAQENIAPKKVITMVISAVPSQINDKEAGKSISSKVGKLIVIHKGSNVSWIYYLQLH
ncbi:hypothetical protein HK100_000034 [Physocladia obscura]|uniref:Hydin adenylate kinase-like domain-containing protein n=1 Tax=Physocladia obscura TaxID=109957 RepID=A0AAD5XKW1_9FUNG|nr:hypothetical protein HK100_000034 [Physocladia obscura]